MTLQYDLDTSKIRQLYEERRFLDAFALTGDIWNHPEVVESFDAETLVLGARLAARLGSGKIERILSRYVLKKFPQEPITRVYARGKSSLRTSVLDYLKDFERQPQLETDDPKLNVSWLCQNAHLWMLVRNFERAETLLTQAEALSCNSSWLLTSKASLALSQDQWEKALKFVEQAWENEAGRHDVFTATVLANCLTKLGHLDKAVERLDQAVDKCQSYQLATTVVWYLLAAAEYSGADKRLRLLMRSHSIVDRLPQLAPLGDRFTRKLIQVIRLDVAIHEHDVEQMQALTDTLNDPYFQNIREHLQQNPHGRVYMGTFQLVWQKRNTCFPASIATVVQSTPPLDADDLAAALTYGGTIAWRVLDWLRGHGFTTKPFIFTAELAKRLFQQGLSFIYLTEEDDWSHAMAAIGYDEATGTLILHDPSQPRQIRAIMGKIEEYCEPFSPEAVAVAAGKRAEELKLIPDAVSRPLELLIEFWKICQEKGISETQALLKVLHHEFTDHPITQRLQAIYFANTGRLAEALKIQETLLMKYPNSIQCRRDLLVTLKRTRDTARILQVYEDFVERNLLPGISEEKSYPSGVYMVDYADFLSRTSSGHKKALKYLHQVLWREPANAAAYHSLGDVLALQGKHRESILPFSIASHLKQEDDHYARSVNDALIQSGDLEQGFTYLQRRIEALGKSPYAFGAWLTYVVVLEDYGYPDQAIEYFDLAQHKFPDVSELLLFGTYFWLRMGRQERAHQLLDNLEQKEHRLYFLEAAVNFYYRRGEWETALHFAEEWCTLKPGDISAFRFYSFLYAFKHGHNKKIKLVHGTVQHFKNDEAFEELYVEALEENFLHAEKIALLRERIRRNNRDGWAWNELCHELLTKAELAEESGRRAILAEVEDVLDQCRKLGAGTFELCSLSARQKFCTGARHEAISLLFEALERNPSHPLPYMRIMAELRDIPQPDQEGILRRLEDKLFCTVNFLSHAVEFAGKIAAQRGLAEAVEQVNQWRQKRPNDPEIALSLARLRLDYGQSRSDAEKAASLLEPLIKRFPNHSGLSLALADAYAILQREEDQILAYRKILDCDPLQQHARRQLSRVLAVSGQLEDAEHLLAEGCRIMPIDGRCWFDYASFLERRNRHNDALEILREAVRKLPEHIQLREHLINQLLNYNFAPEARKHAQELLDIFPHGAYCWCMLADTLYRSPDYSDLKQIESLYRKALSLNSSLFPAAEGLVQLMVSQHRYLEAHDVLNKFPGECREDAETRFLKAWVLRSEGKHEDAYAKIESALAAYPDYERIWYLVMSWIEEDEHWEKAKELLTDIPPVLHSQLDFRTRRLELLQKAGTPVSELDAEWEELSREFPENSRLQMGRFDVLIEAEQWDQAEEILSEYERFDPNSTYLLARKVRILTYREKYNEAILSATKIWTMPGDDEIWPEHFAWEILQQAGYNKESAHAALDAILSGKRLRIRVFMFLLQHLDLVREKLTPPWRERIKSFSRMMTSPRIQAYFTLMDRLHDVDWGPAEHLAAVLSYLDEIKCHKPAVKHCLTHQERYRTMTPVRQNAVMIMNRVQSNKYAPLVREWMKDWREFPGIQMWAVINYLLAVAPNDSLKTPLEQITEQFESSHDCLQTLAFDHTARYMCCLYCEAALRLGNDEEFSQGVERYRSLLEDEQTEYWIFHKRRRLPKTLLLFKALYDTDNSAEAWQISRELNRHRPFLFVSWIAPTWFKLTRDKLSLIRRLWMFCRLLIM